MHNRKTIIRLLSKVPYQQTSHHIGMKKVLLSDTDTPSHITQISVITLQKGEQVEKHVHQTMDEHYLFLSGEGYFMIGGETISVEDGLFILVPAGSCHSMEATGKLTFVTVGVAMDKR